MKEAGGSDEEKRELIINAALKQFAQNGYEKASTNAIIKDAGVSKGLLFHYFENKKQLYVFLFQHSAELILQELMKRLDKDQTDFFEKIKCSQNIKLDIMSRYPEMFNFLKSAYYDSNGEVREEIKKYTNLDLKESMAMLFSNTDNSKFKPGISLKEAINIVIWTAEGFAEEVVRRNDDFDAKALADEFDGYLNILKRSLYKEESID
ncbi:MAG: TetR/AcrR family transcriptional regulator [Bacillota bacterium]|nr:TetR/AcrR family transcriptional regulator [Bacillota bacterium]